MFSLANTSCTCNHDNCFRFSNKANKDLFRFRLPLPKNKLHSSYISFISWNKKDETLSLWNFSSCLLRKLAFCSWDICVLVYKWKFNPLTIHFCEFWFFTQEFPTPPPPHHPRQKYSNVFIEWYRDVYYDKVVNTLSIEHFPLKSNF